MMEKVLNFLVICCFCTTMLSTAVATEKATVRGAFQENVDRVAERQDVVTNEEGMDEGTFSRYSVATTPKIESAPPKRLSRYEQGLEDYDEAAARLDNEEKAERRRDAGGGRSPYSWRGGNNSWESTVNFIGNVVSLVRSLKSHRNTTEATAQESPELARNSSANSAEPLIGSPRDDTDDTAATTEVATVEGRYIKGDPLKGYYDFVITEGSYKFWAAFQLATAALIIYSTFAAIYYSKVNPIVSDYDYVDYLGGGRAMAGGRSFDEDTTPADTEGSWLPSLNSSWITTAVHGFQFVMDAIEKIPQ
ncbi:uncharacterized protein LOC132262042 [Phlebotomus argentipes]|uniref:uncharacterized protein LOC132262042 n=1 Tax=Phlebotomus argentipes TaxID=94469 RepID=UPI002892A11E|nr:uncharacterized protein LOC132262042 [Phlebotomus argentipes]